MKIFCLHSQLYHLLLLNNFETQIILEIAFFTIATLQEGHVDLCIQAGVEPPPSEVATAPSPPLIMSVLFAQSQHRFKAIVVGL